MLGSIALATSEIHINTALRFHLNPVRMAELTETADNECCDDMGKEEPSLIVGGIANFLSLSENRCEFTEVKIDMTQLYHSLAHAQKTQSSTPQTLDQTCSLPLCSQ